MKADAPPPIVFKLGGSLHADPACLRAWLALLADAGAGRAVIVPGGGRFADTVRSMQAAWGCDDLAAHNMAVLAMAQNAHLLQSLCPDLRLAHDAAGLRAALSAGPAVVWLPLDALRSTADDSTDWRTTSDTLALLLAERLGASALVLVKSCPVDPNAPWSAQHATGIVDAAFPAAAAQAACRISLLPKTAFDTARALLLSSPSGQCGDPESLRV